MPDLLPAARALITCRACTATYLEGSVHLCPTPPQHLPPELAGIDLARQLTHRQWMGADCTVCARSLAARLGRRARVLATVRGCQLRACAPSCPPRR